MNNLHAVYQAQGALLRRHRRQAGIDQVSWASRLGVHQSRVSFMERGSRSTLAAHAEEAARQLGLTWAQVQRDADLVAARARIAARAIGVSDVDDLDPEVRYALVRFAAETMALNQSPDDSEPTHPGVSAMVARHLVEDEAQRLLALYGGVREDRLQEAFECLALNHRWRWPSFSALSAEAEADYLLGLTGAHHASYNKE